MARCTFVQRESIYAFSKLKCSNPSFNPAGPRWKPLYSGYCKTCGYSVWPGNLMPYCEDTYVP
ncbi:hypothetical protein KL86DES1_20548 [uncultured Desulfovibrio sp.]|uniref:Uncharacterized protein n=1 Tax=uncultured Desulfovibrio sp. TaxID=167968 RepID=A0A212L4F3_9BACT|nr:hypothetical protein KL86DES1_20548 [uncultured Desulfovibrio sp.]VZH33452.1 conserved protein of unknown function [Desulfovibrio sp. 86]